MTPGAGRDELTAPGDLKAHRAEQRPRRLGGTSREEDAVASSRAHVGSQPGPVACGWGGEAGELRVILSDSAPLFDPPQVPPPDFYLPLEDRPLGGLGVHMMRQLTDDLVYRVAPDGGNELTFVKRGAVAQPEV